ncbi:MAG: DUF3068 domain-containing protein [Actinomycetales bacterium]|nr:DUF3068 domain-containing protein [Actinomycetales bacterium]
MRRVLGYIAIVLGALLVGIGLLAKPFMYDRLAIVPLDQRTTSVSMGENMNVLYPHVKDGAGVIEKLTGVTVQNTREVNGIPGIAYEYGVEDDQAFWQSTSVSRAQVDGEWVDLSYSDSGVSIDRRTGEATNCCGDFRSTGDLDDPNAVEDAEHEGLVFKFPFNVQKQSYEWWDADLQEALPAEFQDEEEIFGTTTYRFQQQIPNTVIRTQQVPGSLFDPPASGMVTANLHYKNTRTLWVEPNTGVVIKGEEQVEKTLRTAGRAPVDFTVGTIGFDEETIKTNAEEWGSKGRLLGLIHGPLMWYLLIPGLILLGLGAFLLLAGGRTDADDEYADEAEQTYDDQYSDRTEQFFDEAGAGQPDTRAARREAGEL